MRGLSEVGRPIIDANPPPGEYAFGEFKTDPYKVGRCVCEEEMADAMGTDDIESVGWLFGGNPYKVGELIDIYDPNYREGLPPYAFAMGDADDWY